MIVIYIKEEDEDLLENNIKLSKKMIQILISLVNQIKYTNSKMKSYFIINEFKNFTIYIVKTMDRLAENFSNKLYDGINISQIKLACVCAITNGMNYRNIGDCGDTSIVLTIGQFIYYHANFIKQIVIHYCTNIRNNLSNYEKYIQICIKKIENTLKCLNTILIKDLSPVHKKFNYNIVDNEIHTITSNLLIKTNEFNKFFEKYK